MERPTVQRKLTTILAADVVGYSTLMSYDEAGTLAALKRHRRELLDPKAAQYRGRTIKLIGDGALMEFGSVVDALLFAIEVQSAMRARNADVPEDQQIVYRVGINIGDIIVEGEDIYGDGVNIAARLEGLAKPGGICVSRTVFNHAKGKLDLTFDALGEHQVKNIPEPVMVLRVVLDEKAEAFVTPVVTARDNAISARFLRLAAIVLVALVAGAGIAWWQPWAPSVEPASLERMAFPLPDKPSIAVLPFNNMSEDEGQEYFADGITDDLITDLSKISDLFVIARNSVFTYKDKAVPVRQVAEEFGVRYVLEGSVRRAGEQVRINAQLIDATTGGHLWADRYDGSLDDVFALQDKVTQNIVVALAVTLRAGNRSGRGQTETRSPEAYDAFLKGWEHYRRQRPDDFVIAIAQFERAIELDPDYARAYAALAATFWQSWKRFWHGSLGLPTWHVARARAEKFLVQAMASPTPLAHQVAAESFLQSGQHNAAIAEAKRAVALDPNDADSFATLAGVLGLAGRSEEALAAIELAMRLNPHFPAYYLYKLGLVRFGMGQFEEAAEALERAVTLNPEDRWSLRLLLSIYGLLGRSEDADRIYRAIVDDTKHGSKNEYLSYLDPLTIRASIFWHPFRDQTDKERFAQGLRLAGVPD